MQAVLTATLHGRSRGETLVVCRFLLGRCEELELVNETGLYRALYRFGHPERCALSQWISDEVVPTLHDHYHTPDASPQRAFMTWAKQRIGVVKWQGCSPLGNRPYATQQQVHQALLR